LNSNDRPEKNHGSNLDQAAPAEVYYDLTRLVERMHAPYATGVDRVDLRYALWTRASASEWRAVVQRRTGFVFLPEAYVAALLKHLSQRWLGEGEGDASLGLSQPLGWRGETRHALREKFSRTSFRAVLTERGIAAALWSRLPCLAHRGGLMSEICGDGSTAIYVNVGHCMRFACALASIPDTMQRVYFLHDVIPLTHPETQKQTSRAHFRQFCRYLAHPMSNVLVSSRATLDAITSLPQDLRQELAAVASLSIVPLAVEVDFITRNEFTKSAETDRYFLSVGTIEPRKNLQLLVELWERCLESGADLPKLIWVGTFAWSCDRQLMRRFERLQAQGHMELRSGLEDSELRNLMAGAIALLFPSKVEGWGLPLSEALALQVPAIASRIAVFEEVGQGVPELLNLEDVERWQAVLVNYAARDSALRAQQLQRMQYYQPLTWAHHFTQLSRRWGEFGGSV
jgi:glycosyltransferase involved in cell wall biosynthesis